MPPDIARMIGTLIESNGMAIKNRPAKHRVLFRSVPPRRDTNGLVASGQHERQFLAAVAKQTRGVIVEATHIILHGAKDFLITFFARDAFQNFLYEALLFARIEFINDLRDNTPVVVDLQTARIVPRQENGFFLRFGECVTQTLDHRFRRLARFGGNERRGKIEQRRGSDDRGFSRLLQKLAAWYFM